MNLEIGRMEYQRELAAFDERIALSELEESKASQRVKELVYQKNRFVLDSIVANLKVMQQAEENQQVQRNSKGG